MIGTSRAEYCFIRTCIFVLNLIAPVCTFYCAVFLVCRILGISLLLPFSHRVSFVVQSWAALEAVFYVFVFPPYRSYLQAKADHPPSVERPERRQLFLKSAETIPDVKEYLRRWFGNAPLEDIRRENVKEFFLWAFFNRDGPPGPDDEELEEYLAILEERLDYRIPDGRGPAKPLLLTLDVVQMLHRSLVWYFVSNFEHLRQLHALTCVVCWIC
jgi:hypothetical protein